ncbi:unnamed protein product, partial [Symbiodinium pilosum]
MKSILEAIAISWRNKMNFGGLVGQLQPLTDQHINFRVVIDFIFGPEASRNFFIHNISSKPAFTEVQSARELEAKVSGFQRGALVYCHAVNEWPVSVVMHLRRADLERGDTRATPDDYYYGLAEEIKKLLPSEDLDFHVWSSPKNIPAFDYHYWKSEDFDGYRQRGMTVHLDEKIDDNDDMLKAWVHMARADIFIMSQSSFSMVPAYMNTNCVIFPSNIDSPLENW